MKTKLNTFFSLFMVLALLLGTTSQALADNTIPDGDGVAPQTGLNFGTVCSGSTATKIAYIWINRNGGAGTTNVFEDGSTVNISVLSVSGNGLTAVMGSPSIIILPTDWESLGNNKISDTKAQASITLVGGSTTGAYSGSVGFRGTGTSSSANKETITRDGTLAVTANIESCTPTDTTKPTLNLPASFTAEATSAAGADVSFTATATDANPTNPTVTCNPASDSTFPLGLTTVNCSATDAANNTATGSFNVTVSDTTPPVIAAHGDETAEATSAAGAVVTYISPATTDAVDGPGTATCAPSSGTPFALGDTKVTCNATDKAGNVATPTTFKVSVVDTTAPTLNLPANIVAEATGPNGNAVTFNPTASDVVDGPVSVTCTPTSGSNFAITTTEVKCSATDSHKNTASGSFNVTVRDTIPPVIAFVSRLPAKNEFGWNKDNVVVTWSCTDSGSGVVAATVSQTASAEAANQSVTGTCYDKAGNSASMEEKEISIDKTAPTITGLGPTASPDGANGWYISAVTNKFEASDNLSGFAGKTNPYELPVSTGAVEGSAVKVSSGTVTDLAGNVATAIDSAAFKVDLSNPTDIAFVGGPADGASYYFGSVPAAPTCTAQDAVSGLASCVVTGYSGAVGKQTLTATATDNAGRTATATRSYTVLAWTLNGFYRPVDMNGVFNVVKNGSTVPLKFNIFAGPTELTDVANVKSLTYAPIACDATAPLDDIETTATGGTALRYDLAGSQFVYNWKTPSTAGKCYRVTMTTQDLTPLVAFFKLK